MTCVWLYIVYIYNSIQHNGDVSPESYSPYFTYVGLSKSDYKKHRDTISNLSLRTDLFSLFVPMFERLKAAWTKVRWAATLFLPFCNTHCHFLCYCPHFPTISHVYVTFTFLRSREVCQHSKYTKTLKALDDVTTHTTRQLKETRSKHLTSVHFSTNSSKRAFLPSKFEEG
jgi:hypothetical protein